jgi:hypothetical protein
LIHIIQIFNYPSPLSWETDIYRFWIISWLHTNESLAITRRFVTRIATVTSSGIGICAEHLASQTFFEERTG